MCIGTLTTIISGAANLNHLVQKPAYTFHSWWRLLHMIVLMQPWLSTGRLSQQGGTAVRQSSFKPLSDSKKTPPHVKVTLPVHMSFWTGGSDLAFLASELATAFKHELTANCPWCSLWPMRVARLLEKSDWHAER